MQNQRRQMSLLPRSLNQAWARHRGNPQRPWFSPFSSTALFPLGQGIAIRPIGWSRKSTERHHQRVGGRACTLSGLDKSKLKKPSFLLHRWPGNCSFPKISSRHSAFHTENNGPGAFMSRSCCMLTVTSPLEYKYFHPKFFLLFVCESVV